jgi:hypothetical protein
MPLIADPCIWLVPGSRRFITPNACEDLRRCEKHGECTLNNKHRFWLTCVRRCRTCPDYEPEV